MAEVLLETVERGPADARAAVIWLHGLGADGWDFHPIVPELRIPEELAVRFVFPHAPVREVTINGGFAMRAWYDIRGIDIGGRDQDAEGIRTSERQVRALIERERARGVPADKIALAGFSQGGAIAIHTGLRHPERLAGLVALSCYAPLADTIQAERHAANEGLPVFAAHGSTDPIVPFGAGEASRQLLERLGYEVEWHSYPMPHSVHPDEIVDIGRWLTARLGPR